MPAEAPKTDTNAVFLILVHHSKEPSYQRFTISH